MTKRLIYDCPQGIVGSLRPNDIWWKWWIDECIGFVENLLLGLMHTWCLMSDKNFWNCDLDGDDSWLWWLTAIGDHHTRGGERPAIRGITPRSAVAPSSHRDADQGAARVSTSAFRSFWGQSGWHKLDWLLQSNLEKLSSTVLSQSAQGEQTWNQTLLETQGYPVSPASEIFSGLLVINSEDSRRVQVD